MERPKVVERVEWQYVAAISLGQSVASARRSVAMHLDESLPDRRIRLIPFAGEDDLPE
jgi:hypothetical protein